MLLITRNRLFSITTNVFCGCASSLKCFSLQKVVVKMLFGIIKNEPNKFACNLGRPHRLNRSGKLLASGLQAIEDMLGGWSTPVSCASHRWRHLNQCSPKRQPLTTILWDTTPTNWKQLSTNSFKKRYKYHLLQCQSLFWTKIHFVVISNIVFWLGLNYFSFVSFFICK